MVLLPHLRSVSTLVSWLALYGLIYVTAGCPGGLSALVLFHVASSAASSGFLTWWPPKGKEQKQQGLLRPRLRSARASLSLHFEQSLSHGQLRFKESRNRLHLSMRKTPKSCCKESRVPGKLEWLWLTLQTYHTKWSYARTWLDKLSCS